MGALRERRGAVPGAAQRDGELWGRTLHPHSPWVPLGTAPLALGTLGRARGALPGRLPTTQGSPAPGSAARRRLINQFGSRRVCFVRLTIAPCKWQPLASSSERLLIKIWKGLFCMLKKKKKNRFQHTPVLGVNSFSGPMRWPRGDVGSGSHVPGVRVSSWARGRAGGGQEPRRGTAVPSGRWGASRAPGLARSWGSASAPGGSPGGASSRARSPGPIPCWGKQHSPPVTSRSWALGSGEPWRGSRHLPVPPPPPPPAGSLPPPAGEAGAVAALPGLRHPGEAEPPSAAGAGAVPVSFPCSHG